MTVETANELVRRARALIPGGVNSPVRAMRAVGLDEPFFVRRGEGAYLEDADGRRLLDWVLSWGPLVFGHADAETVRAVIEAAHDGTSFGAPTEREVELAAELVDAVPSLEQVRLVSSGTEAAMSVVRLARAATRRDRVLKFAGCYHGHVDALLASAGSGLATLGIPSTPGVPPAVAADTIVCPYNDLDAAAEAVASFGEGLACVLVEPVAGNMGVVPPAPGFLEGLRKLCDASGALLVFDEVITGFRVARGGAQERFGVMPDLTLLGKIVGGGLPLAAFGGRRDLMQLLAPAGDVYQAGTLSGNPLATAAGLSVLRRLRDDAVYEQLERLGASLEAGLLAAAAGEAHVQRVGAMLTLFVGATGPVTSFAAAQECDSERYGALFRYLLDAGIYVAPSQFEAMFVSVAHADADVDRTVEAVGDFFAGRSAELWSQLADEAAGESVLWAGALRPRGERELLAVFSPLARPELALGLETIYEGYLVHYGRPRLFDPADSTAALLLGDYLYAHGLVRVAAAATAPAVADLAELIALCAQLRAEQRDGDGAAWAATAALLGSGRLAQAREDLRAEGDAEALLALARDVAGDEAVELALAAHRERVR